MSPPRPAGHGPTSRPGTVLRAAALLVAVAALTVAAVTVRPPDLAQIRAWTAGLGPLAPATFAVAYALTVPAPFPKSVLTAAAGIAFGVPLGVGVVVAGGTAGAVLSFLAARRLGRDAVAALAGGRLRRVDALVEAHGVAAALAVRFVPVLPFTVLNYACGVTAMRLRHYTLGTAVGLVPGSTVWVAVGSLGARISPWLPAGVSVGLGAVTFLVTAVRWRHPDGGTGAGPRAAEPAAPIDADDPSHHCG